ncbi:MAG: RdgB/HAM1 family non-canonical purine NTP pyrophosphatase [Phycisphaerales bacterium]|jgi:XTP/dITP diphosphohydrolase|nr:RdgB/HAM1 family non-canonical purine NTP pyrophosphatase [Phycisphaerales bacterium]
MADKEIVLATGNPGKLREIKQVLADLPVNVIGLNELGDIAEPDETGDTFAQNAREKALYYAQYTGRWCLADDSGLQVDALDGAPGVRSARYSGDAIAPGSPREDVDRANNAKLLDALKDTPDEQRTARFVCSLALARPGEILLETSGAFNGVIARSNSGENGFGYDPLFFVPAHGCTAAELPPKEKNAISHRGRAVRRFAELLNEFLAGAE